MTDAELIDLKERLVIGKSLSPRQRDYALKCINEASAAPASDDPDLSDARRMLVALLSRPNDGPVLGVAELSNKDRCFLAATCSAKIIEAMVCEIAGYREREANEGLSGLIYSMRQHIAEICNLKRGGAT